MRQRKKRQSRKESVSVVSGFLSGEERQRQRQKEEEEEEEKYVCGKHYYQKLVCVVVVLVVLLLLERKNPIALADLRVRASETLILISKRFVTLTRLSFQIAKKKEKKHHSLRLPFLHSESHPLPSSRESSC